jgi:hypothetical protein
MRDTLKRELQHDKHVGLSFWIAVRMTDDNGSRDLGNANMHVTTNTTPIRCGPEKSGVSVAV